MKKILKYLLLTFAATIIIGSGVNYIVSEDKVQAAPASGQPISSYFADPDLAQLVADRFSSVFGYPGTSVDTVLTDEMIAAFTSISILGVDNVTDLSGVSVLSSLEKLKISGNGTVVKVPDDIGSLVNLWDVTLENIGLETFPEGILDLSALEVLYMNNNKMTSLPADMAASLVNLTDFNFSYNNLIDIPASTYNGLIAAFTGESDTFRDQFYVGPATFAAYVGQDYVMDSYPIFSQFLTFSDNPSMFFNLVYPDMTSVIFVPVFDDKGQLMIPGELLTVAGNYQVKADGGIQMDGINLPNVSNYFYGMSYTQSFTVAVAPEVVVLPQTGGMLTILLGASGLVAGSVILAKKKRD